MDDRTKPLDDTVDPEFLEVLFQALSALANVATLASVWRQIRQETTRHRLDAQKHQLQQTIRQITRTLNRVFEDLDELFAIYSAAYERIEKAGELRERPVRFGSAVILDQSEWSVVTTLLSEITNNYQMVRSHCMSLQQNLTHWKMPGEDTMSDDLEGMKDDLNDALFDSATFGEAVAKLKQAKLRADAFLTRLQSLSN